jgi:NAD(P)-dependent dehydrogenase (short-subunit alcohol dehydrogenase family)
MKDISRKTAIVAGAASGIGLGTATVLAEAERQARKRSPISGAATA